MVPNLRATFARTSLLYFPAGLQCGFGIKDWNIPLKESLHSKISAYEAFNIDSAFLLGGLTFEPIRKNMSKKMGPSSPILGVTKQTKSNFPTVRLAVLIWNHHLPLLTGKSDFLPRISSLSSLKGSMCKDSTGTSLCFSHLARWWFQVMEAKRDPKWRLHAPKWPREKNLFGFDVDFDFRIIRLVLGSLLELGTWSEFAHRDRMY